MKKINAVVAALSLLTGAAVTNESSARIAPIFVGGRAPVAADAPCFSPDAGGTSIVNTCATAKNYGMYIPMDTFGTPRNMKVLATGTVNTCVYFAYDSAGTVVTFAGLSTTAFTSITPPANTFSYFVCSVGANSTGRLAGLDYGP